MIGVIVVTHEEFANGIKKATEMIVGEQKKFESIGFYNNESMEMLYKRIVDTIDELGCTEVLIFTDMLGDTPTNASMMAMFERKCRIIGGVNLPMLIECLLNRQYKDIDTLIREGVKSGQDSIKYIDKILIED
ncbi:MAG: PTS sugar transporter subunit IIA [Clostridium sp.]|uniref:PTS sugar transporter subunit IIA n=1 Tax=Clostridium sp. TaxID=1506 RepID=UPI002914B7BF|nr:PTS sugar transporter subunit IIA [Clostridium sp.]MDU5110805.1 PTS sugar transporter subunit IIA [Clostridium sp.]